MTRWASQLAMDTCFKAVQFLLGGGLYECGEGLGLSRPVLSSTLSPRTRALIQSSCVCLSLAPPPPFPSGPYAVLTKDTMPQTYKRKRSWSRAVFSNLQRKGLEKRFEIQKYVTKPDRKQLAAMLGLTDAQVSQLRPRCRQCTPVPRPPPPSAALPCSGNTRS